MATTEQTKPLEHINLDGKIVPDNGVAAIIALADKVNEVIDFVKKESSNANQT